MDYMFYDIEASEGSSMCSFGYVITDENYNIIDKEDILMNPEAMFHTGAWSAKNREKYPGITLAYPNSEFKKQPTFPYFYEKIKSLIQAENRVIIGFSHANDAGFLSRACKRYGLSFIDYEFLDIQNLYCEYINQKNQVALENLLGELGVEINEYTLHKSDDDSEITMLAARELCKRLNFDINTLADTYKMTRGCVKDGKCIYYERERIKQEKNRVLMNESNKISGKRFYKFGKELKKIEIAKDADSRFSGLKVIFSRGYESVHYREMLLIAERLGQVGARYVTKSAEADCFINVFESEEKPSGRYKFIKKRISEGENILIVDVLVLFKELKINPEEYLETALAGEKQIAE